MAAEKGKSSAKATEPKDEPVEGAASVPSTESATVAVASVPAQPTITVDDTNVAPCYSNFCRVSSTPEELILDLGLNPSPTHTGDITVKVSQRIIVNHYTAKRILAALTTALQRHEQTFGVLETDIRRRVRGI